MTEVKKIMKSAAKINGVTLSDQEFNKFELSPPTDSKPEEVNLLNQNYYVLMVNLLFHKPL